jgi:putative transposase
VINAAIMERLREMFHQVRKTMDCKLEKFSGEADHVHLIVDFHPKQSISAVAGSLKASSSRAIRKEFADHVARFYSKPVFWSGSYYMASTGGAPIERLKAYIKNQDKPED